nr:retrovirus-related Pol polyprotein from transposon TNT 1-94 [Tanacetum cinerariifolium]
MIRLSPNEPHERRVVIQDQSLKSIIMSYLSDDIIESVITCETAKATWTDLVHSFKGLLDTKENRIMDLKLEYQTFTVKPTKSLSETYTHYKTLLNELATDGVNLSKHEINVGFVKSILEKWLTFSQAPRNANHTQTLDLLDIYGRVFYENNIIQRSQAGLKIQKDYKADYKKIKAKLALFEANPSTSQTPKTFQLENKGLVAKTFDWDEEEVLDDEEVTQVKVLMALADDELTVGKNHARNGSFTKFRGNAIDLPTLLSKREIRLSETEPTTPSVPTKVKNTKQESKINKLTKLVQMLVDEKILKAKAKPFPPCTYCGFNDHRLDDCRNYPECEIYLMIIETTLNVKSMGSYDHFTSGHNRVIHIRGGVLIESFYSSESSIGVKCNTCGSIVHSTTDHNKFDHFKRGEKIQATKAKEPTKKWNAVGQSQKSILQAEAQGITHVVDADIRLVNDQVPYAEVHLTAQYNVLTNEQQHTDQSEPSYDTYLLEKVDSNTTLDSTNISHRGGEID